VNAWLIRYRPLLSIPAWWMPWGGHKGRGSCGPQAATPTMRQRFSGASPAPGRNADSTTIRSIASISATPPNKARTTWRRGSSGDLRGHTACSSRPAVNRRPRTIGAAHAVESHETLVMPSWDGNTHPIPNSSADQGVRTPAMNCATRTANETLLDADRRPNGVRKRCGWWTGRQNIEGGVYVRVWWM